MIHAEDRSRPTRRWAARHDARGAGLPQGRLQAPAARAPRARWRSRSGGVLADRRLEDAAASGNPATSRTRPLPRRGVDRAGEDRARGDRHHRLLGSTWSRRSACRGTAWTPAEVLESVLSEDVEERIASLLGHPTRDPGDPISRPRRFRGRPSPPEPGGGTAHPGGAGAGGAGAGPATPAHPIPGRDRPRPGGGRAGGAAGTLDRPLHIRLGDTPTSVIGRDVAERIAVSW